MGSRTTLNKMGSVSAMMRAAGFSSEKDFFKAVEAGKIMATDVMPKFASELKKIANTNGALDATTKKTNAQMQRFFNQLTLAKDAIFGGGMDEGLSYMFDKLSSVLVDLQPLLKAVGGAFKGVATVVTSGVKLIMAPITLLIHAISGLWGMFGFGDRASTNIWAIIGGTGVLATMALRFKLIKDWVFSINVGLFTMLSTITKILLPLLVLEDIWVGMKGGTSQTAAGGSFSAQGIFGKNAFTEFLDKPRFFGSTDVNITVNDSEFSKAITVTTDKSRQAKAAVSQTENTQ